ncbi:MAG: hypothetical protein NTW42_06860, partial [Deltaproteobacteria bacterium]|nr:hypothetical protein [Deltaproteobacteria bacterium]
MTHLDPETLMQPFSGIALFRPGLLAKAAQAAVLRGVPLARILHAEYGVARETLLSGLREYYGCASIEYD